MIDTSIGAPDTAVLLVENTGELAHAAAGGYLRPEPFHRGAERTRSDHGGVGLGLAIVERITRAHDGTLTITPRPSGGLRITVELPATPGADTRHLGGPG